MSAQKALQGSETREQLLLEEQKRKLFLGSLICPPGRSMIFYLSEPPMSDCLHPLWLALQKAVRFGVLICPIHIDFQCPNQAAAATELLEDHIAKSLEEAVKIESDEAAVSDEQSASQQPTESDENKTEAKADEASSEAADASTDKDNKENRQGEVNKQQQNNTTQSESNNNSKYRRCSSLKSGKTPPGSPGKRKIVR